MKILFLNPNIDAQHKLCVALQERGAVVLVPANLDEAWKMIQLHGPSLDLAIIHREGAGPETEDQGERLLALIKTDPSQADLAVVFSSATWSDAEFYKHQQGADGANAYLHWPFDEKELISTVESMFGTSLASTQAQEGERASPDLALSVEISPVTLPTEPIEVSEPASGEIKLELANPSPSSSFEAGSLDISKLISEELEPHERLELAQKQGASPDGATSILDFSGGLDPQGAEATGNPQPEAAESSEDGDEDLASELPYLFSRKQKKKNGSLAEMNPDLVFAEPVGDAVIPGGAGQSPDAETLKKYLMLREQDVAILSNQLKSALDQVGALEKQLKEERGKSGDLSHVLDQQQQRIDEFEREKTLALEGLHAELEELKFQSKSKSDKARLLETQVRESTDEIQRLKERVRMDIRKIRVREKDLENKLEIVKKDSEALISSRETKIIELKRKIDLLEFNMDLLQDQYGREKENSAQLRERLAKAAQVVRVAGGLLDTPGKKSRSDSGAEEPEGKPEQEAS